MSTDNQQAASATAYLSSDGVTNRVPHWSTIYCLTTCDIRSLERGLCNGDFNTNITGSQPELNPRLHGKTPYSNRLVCGLDKTGQQAKKSHNEMASNELSRRTKWNIQDNVH